MIHKDDAECLKSLGAHMRRLRLLRTFTQRDLAARAGIDVRYISRLELGHVNPTYLSFLRVAKALELCPAVLPTHSAEGTVPHDLCACVQSMIKRNQKKKMQKALECFDKVLDVKPLSHDMLGLCSFFAAPGKAKKIR